MVVSDKALVAQIKEAYNKGGYTVIHRLGGTHIIQCSFWLVQIDDENLPREVLSLMALHLGFLLKEGEAYKITKTKDGPSAQSMVLDVALSHLRRFEDELGAAAAVPVPVVKTVVTYDGCSVWQKTGNSGVVLLDPRYESIFRKKKEAFLVADALYMEGECSKIFVMQVRRDAADPQIAHLSNMKWSVIK